MRQNSTAQLLLVQRSLASDIVNVLAANWFLYTVAQYQSTSCFKSGREKKTLFCCKQYV